ncbi:hypothetical protein D9M68_866250 [compost metagenome]
MGTGHHHGLFPAASRQCQVQVEGRVDAHFQAQAPRVVGHQGMGALFACAVSVSRDAHTVEARCVQLFEQACGQGQVGFYHEAWGARAASFRDSEWWIAAAGSQPRPGMAAMSCLV